MEAAHDNRRQLGQLMVDEGFLTLDQLSMALAEQDSTGRPLGKILVELGFVSEGAVANALAEQHGGLLKTEFGVSAGLHAIPAETSLSEVTAPEPIDRATRIEQLEAALRTVVGERDVFAHQVDQLHARLNAAPPPSDAEVARATAAAAARIGELEAEVQAWTGEARAHEAEVARVTAAAVAHITGLEAKLAELSSAPARSDEAEAATAAATAVATARIAELEAEVQAHEAEVARVTADAVAHIDGLEAKLAELSSAPAQPDETEAEVARATAAATARIAELEVEVARVSAAAAGRIGELEAALQARGNEPAQPDAAEIARLTEAAAARIAELEADLQKTHAARNELATAVAAGGTRISELERDVAELRRQALQQQQAENAVSGAAVTDDDVHLRLTPSPSGYTVLEWPGPAPASGTLLDVDGARFVVLRVAASPFPGSRLRCAYLDRI